MGSLRQTQFSSSQFCRGHPPLLRWLSCQISQSIHPCFGLLLLLLLLAVPTLLWGRCDRHNSPPASSVVDVLLRCSDGSHVRFHTGYLSLLWSSSSSSPSCSHVVVGLLRQTQFSFSQFCRGHPPPLLRWLSCQISQKNAPKSKNAV